MTIQVLPVFATETKTGRTVRIACGINDALYLDENGDPAGICLPYLRQLAWNNNWSLEYVEGSYNESLQKLYDGTIDLMFPVGEDDDPNGKLAYSDFIGGYQQIGLFAKEDADIYYDDYEGFDHKKVGISMGSNSHILDDYATEHDFTYLATPLNSTKDKINALMNGDVDLIAFSTLNTVPGGKLVAVLEQIPVYFCTNIENQELLQEINSGMSEEMVNTPDIVSDMYQNVMKGNNAISYTKEENELIQNSDQIRFGVYDDCLPLAGIDSEGNCVGIYVDLLKEVEKESGLKIEIVPIEDSNHLYQYLDDGTVDYVIGELEQRFYQENADNHLASNKLADYTSVAVTMPDYRFDDDDSPKFALTRSRNYLENHIYSEFPTATIDYYETRKECLEAIQNGKADATFVSTWEYNYDSKNPRFQDLLEWESIRITSMVVLGSTKEANTEILSILEKTISQLSDDRVSDIIAVNLNKPYDSFDFIDRFYQMKTGVLVTGTVAIVLIICFAIYLNVKKKYIKDLVVANNTKSEFLSRMSHELRTPLNAISGYATITAQKVQKGEAAQEELIQDMDSIQKASDYLLGIITDILDVQRMETGKIKLDKQEINPKDYMNTVVNMVRPMADDKGVTFLYRMMNGAGNNYVLDGLRVQQVLFKILYNAVKFTPEGGKVTMTSEVLVKDEKEAAIRFVISDTGIGMSKEFMETRLFHKFTQENQNITSPYSGCGNGLAICKELVQLMDGEITCESELAKGTTFTIVIKSEYRKREKKRRESKEIKEYNLSGIRILMCEDNPMNQDMEKRIMERMNTIVEIAADGQIGVDKFSESEEGYYDIVLMDIRMPNLDGLEATRMIRSMKRDDAKKVPIIAVSANAFEEDIQKSLEAGMNAHLSKPIQPEVMYHTIKRYLEDSEE